MSDREYPNDKETQEWMNAPLGNPISTPEEQVKFWSDKYDAKVDELHEMWEQARSFEGSFNAATNMIAEQDEKINRLKLALRPFYFPGTKSMPLDDDGKINLRVNATDLAEVVNILAIEDK